MSRRYFTDEQTAEIAQMREQGATLREIIDKYGGTTTSVGNAIQRAGLTKGRIPTLDLTPTQEQEIIDRYEAGESVRALARYYKRRTSVVSELLSRESVTVRYGGIHHRFTAEEAVDLADRYRAGASLRQLAEETGALTTTVRNTLLRQGVQTRESARPVFWTDERLDEIEARYHGGESQSDIAQSLGVNQSSISVALRRRGINTYGPPRKREAHPAWKGGRRVTEGGYVMVNPPEADMQYCTLNSSGCVPEHRLVVGRFLGRKLLPSESVHHINGDKTDNRIENLQLRQGNHGVGTVYRCQTCGSQDVVAVPIAE